MSFRLWRPRSQNAVYRAELRALLSPYLLGAIVLVAIPALLSFALAFTRYDGMSAPMWTGLQNFSLMAADPRFPIAMTNSLFFVVVAVPLRVLGALGLALLLDRRRRGVGVYRAAVYWPTVIPDAAYALIWLWVLNPLYGPLNMILGALGLPTPAWLVDANSAKPALVLMSLFQIGEGFVLLLAALQNVPKECLDAATVDGGNRRQVFRYITLPLIMPWLALLTIRDTIMSFQNTFTPAYLMTGGDPYYATLFMPLLTYEEAFGGLRLGLGSALMLLTTLITALLIGVVYLLFRGRGYAGD